MPSHTTAERAKKKPRSQRGLMRFLTKIPLPLPGSGSRGIGQGADALDKARRKVSVQRRKRNK